jgi:hypothetical protein
MDGSGAFMGGSIDEEEEVVERKRGEIRQKGMGYKAIKNLGSSTYSGQLTILRQG